MKIGLFGGTFDPIHIAHLILAEESLKQLNLVNIKFVLTPDPPHKDDISVTAVEYRLEMLSAAVQNDPRFELSRVELDRSPPHYAIDTVRILKDENPHAHICYLMGGDSLRDLNTWHKPDEFIELCDSIGVMQRPGAEIDFFRLEGDLPGIQRKVVLIRGPLLEISGSKIRRSIKQMGAYRYYLPESVYQIIEKYHLYR